MDGPRPFAIPGSLPVETRAPEGGGDEGTRFRQEILLGIGGLRALRALGYDGLTRFHMNEGHASLLVLELLHELVLKEGAATATRRHVDAIRPLCVFTTHTAVPAGHDQFPLDLVHRVVGLPEPLCELERDFCHEGELNLTYLALVHSHYINGVAKRHREVSQHLFARYQIDSITNGIHVATWASGPMQELFDRHIPGWREDNASLRYAAGLPNEEVWEAHRRNKRALVEHVNSNAAPPEDTSADARSLYDKLEQVILPLYYRNREGFIRVMRAAIALNGSFFNTERMVNQYVTKAYFK